MIIAVGSKNHAKIEATRMAFEKVFPDQKIEVKGVEAPSEISNQPLNDTESITGAKKRAKNAIKKLNADFGIGLEGGLNEIGGKWFETGWIVVIDQKGNEGIGSSIRMEVPDKMIRMIKEGKELGETTDFFFKIENSKNKTGFFGLMSKNNVTRARAYQDGVISALTRFLNQNLY